MFEQIDHTIIERCKSTKEEDELGLATIIEDIVKFMVRKLEAAQLIISMYLKTLKLGTSRSKITKPWSLPSRKKKQKFGTTFASKCSRNSTRRSCKRV